MYSWWEDSFGLFKLFFTWWVLILRETTYKSIPAQLKGMETCLNKNSTMFVLNCFVEWKTFSPAACWSLKPESNDTHSNTSTNPNYLTLIRYTLLGEMTARTCFLRPFFLSIIIFLPSIAAERWNCGTHSFKTTYCSPYKKLLIVIRVRLNLKTCSKSFSSCLILASKGF